MLGFAGRIWSREEGAAAVEFALVCIPLLAITIGIMEFAFALYQWNAAEKATQFGVRIAVVSNPVAGGLTDYDGSSEPGAVNGESPMPDFATQVCNGATSTCTDNGDYPFNSSAHSRILSKMQDVFPRITASNVVVEYRPIQLGFVGRPCGPVPSVTVRLQNMTFDFIVIDAILDLIEGGTPLPSSIAMPSFKATMVGEDLNTAGVACQ